MRDILFISLGSYKRLKVVFVLRRQFLLKFIKEKVFSFENIRLVVKSRVVLHHSSLSRSCVSTFHSILLIKTSITFEKKPNLKRRLYFFTFVQ